MVFTRPYKSAGITLPAIALSVALITAGLAGCSAQLTQSSGYAMGTYIEYRAWGKNAEQAFLLAQQRIVELENRLSWRVPGSDIAKLNAQGQAHISADTEAALILSLEIANKTGGAFDVTIAPVSIAWGIGTQSPAKPDNAELAQLLKLVDYRKLKLNGGTAQLETGQAVDLGAVGKGAACDAAIKAYRECGVKSGLISVGGSVSALGGKPDGTPWSIGIRDPHAAGGEHMAVLELEDISVSTSGSYEKFFIKDGVSYHHIFDARTGMPADSGLVSVTVTAHTGALADALSTACFISGIEDSLPLLEQYGAQAVFITKTNKVYATEGLKGKLSLAKQDYSLEFLK